MARSRSRQAAARQARRAATVPVAPRPTVGTSPALRTPARTTFTGPGPRIGRAKGGGQTSRDGSRSLWSAPADLPYSVGVTAHDPRWSTTLNS